MLGGRVLNRAAGETGGAVGSDTVKLEIAAVAVEIRLL
jgi:hypothetical protein